MLTKLKYALQILALAMFFYRVGHCKNFDKELLNKLRSGIMAEKPYECFGRDNVQFAKCCIAPPFFSGEIAEKCGTKGVIKFEVPEQNVTGLARIGLSCESWTCILDQYHLLVKKMLDDKRYTMHLKRWVKLNPEFKDTMARAIEHCRQYYFLAFPMDPCDYKIYHDCYRNFINLDCPVRVNSTICDEQKKFNDECREYFLKK